MIEKLAKQSRTIRSFLCRVCRRIAESALAQGLSRFFAKLLKLAVQEAGRLSTWLAGRIRLFLCWSIGYVGSWLLVTAKWLKKREDTDGKRVDVDLASSSPAIPVSGSMRDELIVLAIESWRFVRTFDRVVMKLDAEERNRHLNQSRWFAKKLNESLERAEMKIVNIEGQPFDPGMAATPLNIGDFATDEVLEVEQMLEPIITNREGLVRMGVVVLRKAET